METLYKCHACNGHCQFEYNLNKTIDCAVCKGEGYVPLELLDTKPVKESIDEMFQCTGILAMAGVTNFSHGMRGSIPFKLGDKFTTLRGIEVECIQLSETRGYETARFSDGGWRYNRDHDRGRATASRWDSPWNILPKYPEPAAEPVWGLCPHKKQKGGCQFHNLQCGYPKCDTTPKEKIE